LNRDHTITHWNQALEKLTGHGHAEMVGTNRQWAPFWDSERPSMADLILDQKSDQEIWDLYGGKWKKSELIDGRLRSRGLFPQPGQRRTLVLVHRRPDQSRRRHLVGAIETLLDTTATKRAEEEQRRRNRELTTLCTPSTRPSMRRCRCSRRIEGACWKSATSWKAKAFVSTCPKRATGPFDLRYFNACYADPGYGRRGPDSEPELMRKVSRTDKPLVYNRDHNGISTDTETSRSPTFAYIPISAKETKGLGVMRVEKETERFSSEELHLLDLIGNRIGATIENALLQEEVIRRSNFRPN
jgi:hypothetical protein